MNRGSEWTEDDAKAAAAEGWQLDGAVVRAYGDRFGNDVAAFMFVWRQSQMGKWPHTKAIDIELGDSDYYAREA